MTGGKMMTEIGIAEIATVIVAIATQNAQAEMANGQM